MHSITKLIATAAMMMTLPGAAFAASDGSAGATSTGSFDVSLNVFAPTTSQVQVLGLDDFAFGTINTTNNTNTPVVFQDNFFCLNRSDAGDVRFTVSQAGTVTGQPLQLNGAVRPIILYGALLFPAANGSTPIYANTPQTVVQSGAGCTTSSGNGVAHTLRLTPETLPGYSTAALTGAYNGSFTVTVSVP